MTFFYLNTRYFSNISPTMVQHFEIYEDEIINVDSIVGWKYNDDNTHFSFMHGSKILSCDGIYPILIGDTQCVVQLTD